MKEIVKITVLVVEREVEVVAVAVVLAVVVEVVVVVVAVSSECKPVHRLSPLRRYSTNTTPLIFPSTSLPLRLLFIILQHERMALT
ncbi:hypothetical protein E2C01_094429 [Portunus trituberculatus]|uniref:Uncharacterized protein n=1 Tax=Portunus trituberculatus TaxID=210409 RepID=A0A5B7JWU4_PORTR|nr:hypothetical protein [Portunus trituberculatus]